MIVCAKCGVRRGFTMGPCVVFDQKSMDLHEWVDKPIDGLYRPTTNRTFLFPLHSNVFGREGVGEATLGNFHFPKGKIRRVLWTDCGMWTVTDFIIGNRSQFGSVGEMTAKAFQSSKREYDSVHLGNIVSFRLANRGRSRRAWIALEIEVEVA